MKPRLLLILLTGLASLIIPANKVAAAGLTIIPASKNIVLNQNQAAAVYDITLTNSSVVPLEINLETMDFNAQNSTGGLAFIAPSQNYKFGLAKVLGFQPASFSIGPGGQQRVKITITNPSSLSPGGHYGAIIFNVKGADSQGEVVIKQVLSSLVFAVKKNGDFSQLKVDEVVLGQSWLQPPRKVSLTIANSGNVHSTPEGAIKLLGPRGRTIAEKTINNNGGRVLPETARQFELDLGTQRLIWPGYYRLSATTNAGNFERRFLIVPLPAAIVAAALLVGVYPMIYLLKRRYNKATK